MKVWRLFSSKTSRELRLVNMKITSAILLIAIDFNVHIFQDCCCCGHFFTMKFFNNYYNQITPFARWPFPSRQKNHQMEISRHNKDGSSADIKLKQAKLINKRQQKSKELTRHLLFPRTLHSASLQKHLARKITLFLSRQCFFSFFSNFLFLSALLQEAEVW